MNQTETTPAAIQLTPSNTIGTSEHNGYPRVTLGFAKLAGQKFVGTLTLTFYGKVEVNKHGWAERTPCQVDTVSVEVEGTINRIPLKGTMRLKFDVWGSSELPEWHVDHGSTYVKRADKFAACSGEGISDAARTALRQLVEEKTALYATAERLKAAHRQDIHQQAERLQNKAFELEVEATHLRERATEMLATLLA